MQIFVRVTLQAQGHMVKVIEDNLNKECVLSTQESIAEEIQELCDNSE